MTVRELIRKLIEMPMDAKVEVYIGATKEMIEKKFGVNIDELSKDEWFFDDYIDIDEVEEGVNKDDVCRIYLQDWR